MNVLLDEATGLYNIVMLLASSCNIELYWLFEQYKPIKT